MNVLVILVPVSLFLGGLGLVAFVWALRADQYDDLEGDAQRLLLDDAAAPGAPETAAMRLRQFAQANPTTIDQAQFPRRPNR